MNAIAPTPADRIIFLGDLVDRGPDSAGVLRRIRQLKNQFDVAVIRGNHEQMMQESRESHDKFSEWLRNGDCGHTPQLSGRPLNLGYGICLDTNACRGGSLTCMEVNSGTLWQADDLGQVERSHISDYES